MIRDGIIAGLVILVVLFFDRQRFLMVLPTLGALGLWATLLWSFRRLIPAAQQSSGDQLRESLLAGTRRLTLTLTVLAAALFLASFITRESGPVVEAAPTTLLLSWIGAALTVGLGIGVELTGYLHQLHYLSLTRLWEKARSGDFRTGSFDDAENHRRLVERTERVGYALLALQPLTFLASLAYLIAYGVR